LTYKGKGQLVPSETLIKSGIQTEKRAGPQPFSQVCEVRART